MSHWEELVVEAVGKVIEFWGFKRNHGRVWALLYLRATALTAAELEALLTLSKGGVSMLLRDLEQWSVVRKDRAPGEAALRYSAETRLFDLVRQVVAQREMRFISEIRTELTKAHAAAVAAKTSPEELRRLGRLRQLAAATEHTLRLFCGRVASTPGGPLRYSEIPASKARKGVHMDRHYEMVMDERAKADASPRQYFGYSTILDPEAYAEWRSQHGYDFFQLPEGEIACALDVTLAYDFPSRFWGGRVAGLVDAPGKKVWGKLFSIAGTDWPIIRHKEGGITEMSVERQVQVSCGGKVVTAVAFETNPRRRSTQGEISPHFRAALVAGAKAAGLPVEWVTELASLG